MAKFKARRVNVFSTNKLLWVLAACAFLCIWFMSLLSDSSNSQNHNVINPIQNIKIIERVDPLTSILKEGEELYLKEADGQIKRINEVIRIEDGIKIPQAILDSFQKVETIQIESVGQGNFKLPADIEEINKNIIDCMNSPPNSPNWKIINFSHQNVVTIPTQNVNFVENIDDLDIHKKIIEQIEKLQSQQVHTRSQQTTMNRNCESEEIIAASDNHPNTICANADIEKLIYESIVNEEWVNSNTTICNTEETEVLVRREILSSHSKCKYLVIYTCIVLPLFVILYIQHERINKMSGRFNMEDITSYVNSKSWKGAKSRRKANSTYMELVNTSSFGNGLLEILFGAENLGPPIYEENHPGSNSDAHFLQHSENKLNYIFSLFIKTYQLLVGCKDSDLLSDGSSKLSKSLKQRVAAKNGNNAPCKYCNDYNDYNCPNHYHLYSTDEASSSEPDFAGPVSMKSGKAKAKKRGKDVKKSRNAY